MGLWKKQPCLGQPQAKYSPLTLPFTQTKNDVLLAPSRALSQQDALFF